jgi:hypothetical protein
MNKILISVKSGWQFRERRLRCLNTWMLSEWFTPHRLDAVFTLGVPQVVDAERHGNMLFLPAPNEFAYLPQRMRLFCQWALKQDWWNYLWCMDDDTRLSIPRLTRYETNGADYIGPEWTPGAGFASGGGHFLSRRAASLVAERLTQQSGPDDLLVGQLLYDAGINLTVDNEHFKVMMPLEAEPGPDNNWVYSTPKIREGGSPSYARAQGTPVYRGPSHITRRCN